MLERSIKAEKFPMVKWFLKSSSLGDFDLNGCKMFRISVVIFCFLIALSSVSTEEELREFHFTKVKDANNEFLFEWVESAVFF